MNNKHIEDCLAKIRVIFEQASAQIEALKPGEKIPATALAESIAKQYGMTGPQLYPTLKFLFDKYPGVDIKKGAHGGIIKQAVATAPVAAAPAPADDTADSQ
jgi:hypothetical protein